MRRSDRRSAQPIHEYLTQSPFTAEQIERFYGRPAAVIGAPVDCDLFHPAAEGPDDYYLFCGRLIEPYKQVGIAIEAFRRIGPAAGRRRRRPRPRAAAPQARRRTSSSSATWTMTGWCR